MRGSRRGKRRCERRTTEGFGGGPCLRRRDSRYPLLSLMDKEAEGAGTSRQWIDAGKHEDRGFPPTPLLTSKVVVERSSKKRVRLVAG